MANLSDSSPLEPARLAQLYARPTAFFTRTHVLDRKPEILIVGWIVGMAGALDRVDWNLTKIDLGSANDSLTVSLAQSWKALWIFIVVVGIISGAMGWLIGGWWYRKRLEWSGARSPDPTEARLVWLYASLIAAVPSLGLLLIDTYRYEDYLESWEYPGLLTLIPALALFWSVYISNKGATTRFNLKVWPARMWFFVIPMLLYFFVTGLVGYLYTQLSDGAAA